MKTLARLEYVLGEASQCLDDAARLIREIPELEMKACLCAIGGALNHVWELREKLHGICPDLRPSFVKEYQADVVRYEKLQGVADEAYRLEDCGDVEGAAGCFERLVIEAETGYFKMVGEAGLYRLAIHGKGI